MLKNSTSYAILALIILGFLIIGGQYAARTPAWQNPDEPAHYNYIAQVADHGCCPVIEPSDWDAAELEALKSEGFPDDADLSGVTYEDWQPPVYYILASPIFNASKGDLFAVRLVSLVFGACAIAAAYWVVHRLFPRHQVLALATAVFVAFVPQHIAVLSSINNDSLALLELSILLVIAVGYVGNPTFIDYDGKLCPFDESQRPHAAAMGGFLGLILITKLTPVLPAAVIILLAIAWRWRIEGRSAQWLIEQLFWGFGLGAIIGGTWWVRNITVYGFPDILGFDAHNTAVVGQPRTAEAVAESGQAAYWGDLLRTTYHSFFGQFGWMAVPMQPRDYLLIGAFLIWALIGLILLMTWFYNLWTLAPQQRAGVWILIATMVATILVFLYYNMTFVQFQGRYLFGMLIPLGLTVAAGGWGWVLLLGRWIKGEGARRVIAWLPLVSVLWLPVLAMYALVQYVVVWLK